MADLGGRSVTIRRPREVATGTARRMLSRFAGRAGYELYRPDAYELVRKDYYSPLPDLSDLPHELWEHPSDMPGVDLRLERAVELLTGPLRPHLESYRPPLRRDDAAPGEFHLSNNAYDSVDAEVLYAFVRHLRPKRVIELGSGASSHVISAARAECAADGAPFEYSIFDPYPFEASIFGPVTGGATVTRQRSQDIPLETFDWLEAGDLLFVDTTHTVKTGGDVNRILLDVLPRLAAGVTIHFHDIFLPYEYPRGWVLADRRAWAEQYLLQAFLAFNDEFEVVFPSLAVLRHRPELVKELVPSVTPDTTPGSFWIRRVSRSEVGRSELG